MITTCINCNGNRLIKGYLRPITDYKQTSTFSVLGNAYNSDLLYDTKELMDMEALICQDCGMVTFMNNINKTKQGMDTFEVIGGRTLDKNKILIILNDIVKTSTNSGFTLSNLAAITELYPSPGNPNALVLKIDRDIMPDDIIYVSYTATSDNTSASDKMLSAFKNLKIQNTLEDTFIYITNAIAQKDSITIYARTDTALNVGPLTMDQINCFSVKMFDGIHKIQAAEIIALNGVDEGSSMIKITMNSTNKISSSDEPVLIYLAPTDNAIDILGFPNGILYNSSINVNTSLIPEDLEKNILLNIYKSFETKESIKVSIRADILKKDFDVQISDDAGVSFASHEFVINMIETEIIKSGTVIDIGTKTNLINNKNYQVKIVNKNYGKNGFKSESQGISFETNATNMVMLNIAGKDLDKTTGRYNVDLEWKNVSNQAVMAYIKRNRSDSNTWVTDQTILNIATTITTVKGLEAGYKYQFKLTSVINVPGSGPQEIDSNILPVNIDSADRYQEGSIAFGLKADTIDSTKDSSIDTNSYYIKLSWDPPNKIIANIDSYKIYYDTKPIDDPKLLSRFGFIKFLDLDPKDFSVTEFTDKILREKNTCVYYFVYAIDKSGKEYYSDIKTVEYMEYMKNHDISMEVTSIDQQSITVNYKISDIEDTVSIFLFAKDPSKFPDNTVWPSKTKLNKNDALTYQINGLDNSTVYAVRLVVKWPNEPEKFVDGSATVGVNSALQHKTINIDTRDAFNCSYNQLLEFRQNIGEKDLTAFTNTRNEGYFYGVYDEFLHRDSTGKDWEYHNVSSYTSAELDYIPKCIRDNTDQLKSYTPTNLYQDYGSWDKIKSWYCSNNKLGADIVTTVSYKDSEGFEGDVVVKWHEDIHTFDDKAIDSNGIATGHILKEDGTPITSFLPGCKWIYMQATNYWWEASGTVIKRN